MSDGIAVTLRQEAPIPLDFALSVGRRQTAALVGPSGAGKTTVLRCIAGLHDPAAGEVRCDGEIWLDTATGWRMPAHARRVGFVPQSYALFPHLSAIGNVMEAMLDLPPAGRRARAAELLELVQLQGLEERRPSQLSGGQQQRVALARALAREPRVLLLDEPFSAVDHPTRRALHATLRAVRERTDVPIILVTHDIDDAARVADTICLVINGRAMESGPVHELLGNSESALSRWMAT